MRSALNSSVAGVLATEGDRLFQCGIFFFFGGGHHCMSGIYNIAHYVMPCQYSSCEQGSFILSQAVNSMHIKCE